MHANFCTFPPYWFGKLLIMSNMRLAAQLLSIRYSRDSAVEIVLPKDPVGSAGATSCVRRSGPHYERYCMKPLYNFVSDNGPFLFICCMVLGISASLLLYTAAYIRA